MVARHLTECIGKLFVRTSPPEQLSILAMEGHLEDAILPLHLDELETILVVVEVAHRYCSAPRFTLRFDLPGLDFNRVNRSPSIIRSTAAAANGSPGQVAQAYHAMPRRAPKVLASIASSDALAG